MSLTPEEHQVVQDVGVVWNEFVQVVGDGPTRDEDLREAIVHFHAIQHAVLAQAAAREYPQKYRLLGEVIPTQHEPFPYEAFGVPRPPENHSDTPSTDLGSDAMDDPWPGLDN